MGVSRLNLAREKHVWVRRGWFWPNQPRQTQTRFSLAKFGPDRSKHAFLLVRLWLERPKRPFCERFVLASAREAKAKVSFWPLEAEPDKQNSVFGFVEAELGKRTACLGLPRLIRPKSASMHPCTRLTHRDICHCRCRTIEYSNRAEVGDISKGSL